MFTEDDYKRKAEYDKQLMEYIVRVNDELKYEEGIAEGIEKI